MPRPMSPADAIQTAVTYMPSFLAQREQMATIDTWMRNEQKITELYVPKDHAYSREYAALAAKAPTPWLKLVVRSLTQTMFLEGIRAPKQADNLDIWSYFQRNKWDSRQIPLHTAAVAHGIAFVRVRTGVDPITGDNIPLIRPRSANRMAAFYSDDENDLYPMVTLDAKPYSDPDHGNGWDIEVTDETADYVMSCRADGQDKKDYTFYETRPHGLGLCPVSRYAPFMDIDEYAESHIRSLIPLAQRIDQTVFDRIIVQRFGAWKIRWASGIKKPANMSEDDFKAALIELKINDFFMMDDPASKVGVLDATDLKGFIEAHSADLRDMSAVSQTPPHHLLGLSSNLQSEALAAAEAGLQRLSVMARTSIGESHETTGQLTALVAGNKREAAIYDAQSRWRDMESRSFAQMAQALGLLATQLKVPIEMLWERVPNWTDSDTARAKDLLDGDQTQIDAFLATLDKQFAQKGLPTEENPAPNPDDGPPAVK